MVDEEDDDEDDGIFYFDIYFQMFCIYIIFA